MPQKFFTIISFVIIAVTSGQESGSGDALIIAVTSGQESGSGDALGPLNFADTCDVLYLLNVVPYPNVGKNGGWDKGFELIPAGHLATEHINNNSDILQGYKLEVIDVPSENCGESIVVEGLLEVYQLLFRRCIFGIVGLYCSTVTNVISRIANHPRLGYVQLAASTSPQHRDVAAFPHTFHTIASSRVFNEAMIAMMDEFEWVRISVVHDSLGFYFRTTSNDFVELSKANNKSIISRISILPQEELIPDVFDLINQQEARIGYFSISEGESAIIFCEAYNRQFIWPGYAYILHERSLKDILKTPTRRNCTIEQMKEALEGVFILQYRLSVPRESKLISGLTYEQYHDEYIRELLKFSREKGVMLEDNLYANSLYDQVWAYALAVNKSLDTISFINASIATSNIEISNTLARKLEEVSFIGATGFIEFGEEHEVPTFVDIFQVKKGEQVLVGTYNAHNRNISFFSNFNREVVPRDTFDLRYQLVPVWIGALVIACDLFLIILITFNTLALLLGRNRPEIRSSSYTLSLVILIGCYILCFPPVLITVHAIFVISDPTVVTVLCNLELCFFLNGMNIVFVALLMRLFRIYNVFRSFHTTGKYWSDKYLIIYIVLICSVLVVLLVLWVSIDPVHHLVENMYVPSARPPHYLVRGYCSSKSLGIWLALSLGLIGLVMVLVIFLAVQTRHIKRRHYKDTKKVNIFIFSVSITCAIFIPLWLILFAAGFDIGAYISKCIANMSVAALGQIFIFLPKVLPSFYYKWRPERPATITDSSLHYINSNAERKTSIISYM